ncbi:MAG: hypothetical protein M1834_006167 [Cirrosporium novae-zelandiae]|nr:MAG: hypothetical protein M1834_006167 [Cirrosporium novae-zelandiae]
MIRLLPFITCCTLKASSKELRNSSLRQIFSAPVDEKAADKDEEKKVKALAKKINRLGVADLKEAQCRYALRTKYSEGDVDKAYELLVLYEDAMEGIVRDYNPETKLLGAENRQNTTCYLDALLFAMFARLGNFEAILYNTFDDEPRKRLSTFLRLWVNMLRSGKLITTDITEHLQEALAVCGWRAARDIAQQDASEAFGFITGQLQLPLLTLKMDIFHTGTEDATDDHKFVNERLLEVAIPQHAREAQDITLEECLEEYFNNRIEVKRYLERQGTIASMKSIDSMKGAAMHIESLDLEKSRPDSPTASSVLSTSSAPSTPVPPTVSIRPRASSIIQPRWFPETSDILEKSSVDSERTRTTRRRGTIRKEVMMPAWQFYRLIPWYTDNTPDTDAQVAAHFSSTRPILGICLKRYSMKLDGTPTRLSTRIDIPVDIALPHFIQDDQMNDNGPLYGNFELSLQSAVCHRGTQVNSGHYISLVRGSCPNAHTQNGSAGSGRPHIAKGEDTWLLFDDLAKDRVTVVDIHEALERESPYLLFYQVHPIEDDLGIGHVGELPPSYAESERDSGVGLSTISGQSSNSDSAQRPSIEISEVPTPPEDDQESRRPSQAPSTTSVTSVNSTTNPRPASTDGPADVNIPSVDSNTSLNASNNVVSRRGSRISIFMSSMRGNDEKRKSGTFPRLNIRLPGSNNKLENTPDSPEHPPGDEDAMFSGNATPTVEIANQFDLDGTNFKSKKDKGKKKKARSRSRGGTGELGKHYLQGHGSKRKEKEKPERECIVM